MEGVRLKNWITLLRALFLCASLVFLVAYNFTKPRLLILHSYDLGYSWTRDMNEGLQRVLKNYASPIVYYEYMDTKKHPSHAYKQKTGLLVRKMIDRLQPHVIIALDDDAQEHAARFYLNDPHIKIVFAGVNTDAFAYGYDRATNVTGVLERLPLDALKEALSSLPKRFGDTVRIINMGDESGTVRKDEEAILKFNWGPQVALIDSILVHSFEEWKEAIENVNKRADALFLTNYRNIHRTKAPDSPLVPPQEVMAWTMQNTHIPVIGANGFVVEDGADFALGTSPFEQGELAARKAVALLEGKEPREVPIEQGQYFMVFFAGKTKGSLSVETPPHL